MSYRPQNGIPVTTVTGMPMAVGFNPGLVAQPVMMPLGVPGQPVMVRQTMMPSMIVANPSINQARLSIILKTTVLLTVWGEYGESGSNLRSLPLNEL